MCCDGQLRCLSRPHVFQWYFLQEAATAISEEVSILRTDEPDSRVIMSGQREVRTALIIIYKYLINMSYKHCEVSLSTFRSLFDLFSKMVLQDSFGIGIKVIILYWSGKLYLSWLNCHACYTRNCCKVLNIHPLYQAYHSKWLGLFHWVYMKIFTVFLLFACLFNSLSLVKCLLLVLVIDQYLMGGLA